MITIIDYDRGNLFSLSQAIRHLGSEFEISGDPAVISKAERLLLPGVGAFGDGFQKLQELGLVDEIRKAADRGVPILGICLGMQLLGSQSEEFGHHPGLDLIPGTVKRLPKGNEAGDLTRVPNVGWRQLNPTALGKELFRQNLMVYFLHSYALEPQSDDEIMATIKFGNKEAVAAVKRRNILGYQFHPEKSGKTGLALMRIFLEMDCVQYG